MKTRGLTKRRMDLLGSHAVIDDKVETDLGQREVKFLGSALGRARVAGQVGAQIDDWNDLSVGHSTLLLLAARYRRESTIILVIGAPMYNFTIPSQLKAWFDRIIITGKTFSYSEAGAKGLAGGKKVIVASSRGGLYAPGTPQEANDFQEPFLRAILGFIGIKDIEIVRAEGVAYGR